MSDEPAFDEHDPELAKFLDRVIDLGEGRRALGPEAFFEQLAELEASVLALVKYRSERALVQRFVQFAERRFALVDDPSEYAHACDEVQVLALALDQRPALVIPALRRSVELLSGVLGEDGVVPLFGQLLKRLRQLARRAGDADASAWVDGVIASLPGA